MDAHNGIDNGKLKARKRKLDLFRPVSVKSDGRRLESANWCVRFQHKGKRTCRSLGTADYRLALQRARCLVKAVRADGWASATVLPTSHGSLTISDFLERYHRSAVSRGLRPRSIAAIEKEFRRISAQVGARRLADLTPVALQQWVENCGLKPVTLKALLKNAACPFSRPSLQAMGMAEVENPFAKLVRPKVDQEPFDAPPRSWIKELMRAGISELSGDVRLAFVLALGCGLRWGEIVSATWAEAEADGVRIPAGKAKGRRARVIPIGEPVRDALEASQGQGLVIGGDAKEVHEALCEWLRKRGVKDLKPVHYLRKCYGSLAVADHGVFIASKLLGHASISQTASTYAGQVDKLPAVKF
jgi:integrase